MESKELTERIATILKDNKGEDIKILNIGEISSIADFFVIATANSSRQVSALADLIRRELKKEVQCLGVEGYDEGVWVIVDFGNVVAHVFQPEARKLYDLEGAWREHAKTFGKTRIGKTFDLKKVRFAAAKSPKKDELNELSE